MYVKLLERVYQFILLVIISAICLFCIRAFEYSYFFFKGLEKVNFSDFFEKSINFDVLALIIYGAILFLPMLMVSYLHAMTAKIVSQILFLVYVYLHVALTQYFLSTHSLLSFLVFEFSISDIVKIVVSEFTAQRALLWFFNLSLLSLAIYLIFVRTYAFAKYKAFGAIILFFFGLVATLVNIKHTFKEFKYFESHFPVSLREFKAYFFCQ